MMLLARVHPCVGKTAPLHLTSYPEFATDGADFTLSCTHAQGRTLITVNWHRNNVNIFDTGSGIFVSAAILHPLTTSPEYQAVSRRISVSSSLQQHSVTLRTNSPLDQGSLWRCQTVGQFSNNLTIEVKESIRGASSPGPKSTRDSTMFATEGQHTGPSSTDDTDMMTTTPVDPAVSTKCGNILLITAAAGSIIVVIVIVVAIATSVLLVRKYKQDIAENNSQMYSTMSRDPNTDNNYTELDHGHTGEKFPTSLSANTEESPAYYNTAPADSQYENPPASTE
ncbi:uncharacterized protein LOC124113540 [Haliotis rufescens]|uniref:uncharacterized protein LOC124113540 n=1 Tax=Haliotis rufescens TaxID=6454 RepID=UPI00201EC25E|nr:uncharacterized protein LOC124113540 [Haliotis rufescens]